MIRYPYTLTDIYQENHFPLKFPFAMCNPGNPPISFDKNFIDSGGQQNQFWGTTAPVLVSSQCTTVSGEISSTAYGNR